MTPADTAAGLATAAFDPLASEAPATTDYAHYPLPAGLVRGNVGTARTRDGVVLRTRSWGATGEPRARVLLVHGLSEHSGRYEHVGGWLARAGYEVHAYDQRGWGASGGLPGHVDRWTTLHEDLGERIGALRARQPALPLVVYAHSMGGLVTTGYLLGGDRDRLLPDMAVLSGPGLLSVYPAWLVVAAKVLGRIAPTVRPSRPDNGATLSRDPEVPRRFGRDPLHRDPTTGFGMRGLQAQVVARRGLEALATAGRPFPVPALVLHGEDDRLVPFAATDWYRPLAGVEIRPFPGLRHELHNEPEGETIVAGVAAWIASQLEGTR